LLSIYLDEYDETPWEALKYLIAGVNYGGHVTDDFDRRLLHSYINTTFCPDAISTPFYKYVLLLCKSVGSKISNGGEEIAPVRLPSHLAVVDQGVHF